MRVMTYAQHLKDLMAKQYPIGAAQNIEPIQFVDVECEESNKDE